MKSAFLFVLLCFIAPCVLHAFNPGSVEGSLRINDSEVRLKWAYARLHDNAEGVLDRSKKLRILLTDREVPADALDGIVFLPVEEMAKQGTVQGLLLELDPKNPGEMVVTLLYPPSDPGYSLVTQTISLTRVAAGWSLDSSHVSGTVEHHDDAEWDFPDIPRLSYMLQFNAPLSHEPRVTEDLKKNKAVNSPQVKVLAAKADALIKGDFVAVQELCSERAQRHNDVIFAQRTDETEALAKEAGTRMKKSLKKVQRVVVRGNRAVVIFSGKEWATLVLENGEWKSDD
jgi:hypothetical protein